MNSSNEAITVFTTIIGFVTLVYKLCVKKNKKREENYYKDFLKPIIAKIKSDKEIKIMEEVKTLINNIDSDDNIPRYIFYLVDNEREDELEQVIMCDYITLYPNENNKISSITETILKVMNYIALILGYAMLILGPICISTSALLLVYNIFCIILKKTQIQVSDTANIDLYSAYLLLGIVFTIIGIYFMKKATKDEDDRYTTNIEYMEKMIKRKGNKYPRLCKKHYVYNVKKDKEKMY